MKEELQKHVSEFCEDNGLGFNIEQVPSRNWCFINIYNSDENVKLFFEYKWDMSIVIDHLIYAKNKLFIKQTNNGRKEKKTNS